MSVIREARREREDLARVLKKHKGIRRIVEDLYPDSAHFIYELLQNAEDISIQLEVIGTHHPSTTTT
jgi:DNA replication initiation complex subunit (GINS family)